MSPMAQNTWFHQVEFIRLIPINSGKSKGSCWLNQFHPILWFYRISDSIQSIVSNRSIWTIISSNTIDPIYRSIWLINYEIIPSARTHWRMLLVFLLAEDSSKSIAPNWFHLTIPIFVREDALSYAPHLSPCWRFVRINCYDRIHQINPMINFIQ